MVERKRKKKKAKRGDLTRVSVGCEVSSRSVARAKGATMFEDYGLESRVHLDNCVHIVEYNWQAKRKNKEKGNIKLVMTENKEQMQCSERQQ